METGAEGIIMSTGGLSQAGGDARYVRLQPVGAQQIAQLGIAAASAFSILGTAGVVLQVFGSSGIFQTLNNLLDGGAGTAQFAGLVTFGGNGYALTAVGGGKTTVTPQASASNFNIMFPAASGTLALTSGAGVESVSNSDGSLTISPTTLLVVASLNVGHTNTWSVVQNFAASGITLLGSSTGTTTFASANAGASNFTLTFQAVTDTVAVLGTAQNFSAAQSFTAGGTALSVTNNATISGTLTCANVTAGANQTIGTTSANTLVLETGGSTRYTFAAASGNVTIAGASTWAAPSNTASAIVWSDGTNAYQTINTQTATDNVVANTFSATGPSYAAAAGSSWSLMALSAVTLTFTGTTTVTAVNGLSLNIARPTITDASAGTVTTTSTVYIAGAPNVGGSITLTNAYALNVAQGLTVLQATTLQASPLNFTAGGAFVLGTTDANTVALKTGGTTRWTWAAASANVTFAAASSFTVATNSASAWILTDGGASPPITVNTQPTTSGVTCVLVGSANNISINSAAGVTYSQFGTTAVTVTLVGATGVTAMNGVSAIFNAATITDVSGITVTTASTVYISNAPTAGGSVTITNAYALQINAGLSLFPAVGFMLGASAAANQFATATHGAASTQMFIGNSSINVTSDVRLKTRIEPTQLRAVEAFRQLHVIDYTWNDPVADPQDDRGRRGRWVGITAQDLIGVVPWVVNAEDRNCPLCCAGEACAAHPHPWFVEYEHLVPALVKAVQELDVRVSMLEAKT